MIRNFKGKATDNEGLCVYLNKAGKKCGIGCFIPDGHEAQESVGNVQLILCSYPELWEYMPIRDINKLDSFQKEHDNLLCNTPVKEQLNHLLEMARIIFA